MALLDNRTQLSVLVDGLDHPEGIAWGLDGYAYAGGEAGQIYRIDVGNQDVVQVADTKGFILGLALDANNNIYACDVKHKSIIKITPGGITSTYSTGTRNEPFILPNFLTFDSSGYMYVSDSGEWKEDNGRIYKVHPGGQTEVWCRELETFPNGHCLGPDGDYLYIAMSLNQPRVERIKIEDDGSAGPHETVVKLPSTVPDGVAFDVDGNIYVSMYRPDRIYRYSSSGELAILADDYEGTIIAGPTNVAFCGIKRDILLSANIGRWHITKLEANATGITLQYPSLE